MLILSFARPPHSEAEAIAVWKRYEKDSKTHDHRVPVDIPIESFTEDTQRWLTDNPDWCRFRGALDLDLLYFTVCTVHGFYLLDRYPVRDDLSAEIVDLFVWAGRRSLADPPRLRPASPKAVEKIVPEAETSLSYAGMVFALSKAFEEPSLDRFLRDVDVSVFREMARTTEMSCDPGLASRLPEDAFTIADKKEIARVVGLATDYRQGMEAAGGCLRILASRFWLSSSAAEGAPSFARLWDGWLKRPAAGTEGSSADLLARMIRNQPAYLCPDRAKVTLNSTLISIARYSPGMTDEMLVKALEEALRRSGRSSDDVLTIIESRLKEEAVAPLQFFAQTYQVLTQTLKTIADAYDVRRSIGDQLLEKFALANPDEFILERMREGVFPPSERGSILRRIAMASFEGYERFSRIGNADFRSKPAPSQLDCKTSPVQSLTGKEYAGLVTLRGIPCSYPTEVAVIEHACQADEEKVLRKAYQVRVTMLERTYSREFACPLVPKPAKAPSLHGEPILPDGAALA